MNTTDIQKGQKVYIMFDKYRYFGAYTGSWRDKIIGIKGRVAEVLPTGCLVKGDDGGLYNRGFSDIQVLG